MLELLGRLSPAVRVTLFVLLYLALLGGGALDYSLILGHGLGAGGIPPWAMRGALRAVPLLLLAGLCFLFTVDRDRRVPVLAWMTSAAVVNTFCGLLLDVFMRLAFLGLAPTITPLHMGLEGVVTGVFLALAMGAPRKAVQTGALLFLANSIVIPSASAFLKFVPSPLPVPDATSGVLFALLVAGTLEYFQARKPGLRSSEHCAIDRIPQRR